MLMRAVLIRGGGRTVGGHSQPRPWDHPSQSSCRVHPGARRDGEVGKEVRAPPKVPQANFCVRVCAGVLKGRAKPRAGGSALAPSPRDRLIRAAARGRESRSAPLPLPCPALPLG